MGPIAVCKEFLPLLKQSQASRIINISSSCAETRLPMASVYGASKVNRSFRWSLSDTNYRQAGLEAFNDSLRIEASPVHLILIEPGELFSLTPMGSKQTSHYQTMKTDRDHINPKEAQKIENLQDFFRSLNPGLGMISDEHGVYRWEQRTYALF